MQLRPLPNRAKPVDDVYLWTAAKEENVQNIIKMQRELDGPWISFFFKKIAQEAVMQNVQRNGLDWEKRNGQALSCQVCFFIETMAKSPQISEKNLYKWDDIINLPTEGKEFP